MHIIKAPSIGISAEDLFLLCAESVTNTDDRNRLLTYRDKVRRHAEDNPKRIPADIATFLKEIRPEQVPKEDMEKMYEDKLVKGNKERRGYYLAILRLAPNRRCPICGVNRAETLDHYLPKSKIPTLAVDPGNLIPACDRCNRKKGDKLSYDPCKLPVHIYYDRIPEGKWLHVNLGDHLEAEYYTECPDTEAWEPGIRSRVGRHLEIYKLEEVYEDAAAEELAIMKNAWTTELRHLREDSEDELPGEAIREEFREFIVKRRESFELGDENSFESAFYRAVEQSMETAYAFFGL